MVNSSLVSGALGPGLFQSTCFCLFSDPSSSCCMCSVQAIRCSCIQRERQVDDAVPSRAEPKLLPQRGFRLMRKERFTQSRVPK